MSDEIAIRALEKAESAHKRIDKHDIRSDSHEERLHEHGKKITTVMVTQDVMNESIEAVRDLVKETPKKMRELMEPVHKSIDKHANLLKGHEERYLEQERRDAKRKYLIIGGLISVKLVVGGGIWAVYEVIQLIKAIKGV